MLAFELYTAGGTSAHTAALTEAVGTELILNEGHQRPVLISESIDNTFTFTGNYSD